ncbi:succinate--CoA ligase subunit alpha [[Eubacterium] cellulosolvens]
MAIIIDSSTKVVVQGITGGQGKFHTARIKEYGTNIVAGVTPGKGGETVEGVPVFDSFDEIPDKPTATIIFVPAPFAKDAALEAIEFGLNPVVVITEHIPVHDSLEMVHQARKRDIVVVGPNTPGIITPGQCKMGVMPAHVFSPGNIGLISRSGTLTYEIVDDLTKAGLGQSTAVGLGGDPIVGLSFIDLLQKFEADSETKGIVMIGEIGGSAEEAAAEYIKNNVSKPVVAYIAGRAAPKGKTMGHAGAIITGSSGTAESKIQALEGADVAVATRPIDIPKLMKERLGE